MSVRRIENGENAVQGGFTLRTTGKKSNTHSVNSTPAAAPWEFRPNHFGFQVKLHLIWERPKIEEGSGPFFQGSGSFDEHATQAHVEGETIQSFISASKLNGYVHRVAIGVSFDDRGVLGFHFSFYEDLSISIGHVTSRDQPASGDNFRPQVGEFALTGEYYCVFGYPQLGRKAPYMVTYVDPSESNIDWEAIRF